MMLSVKVLVKLNISNHVVVAVAGPVSEMDYRLRSPMPIALHSPEA